MTRRYLWLNAHDTLTLPNGSRYTADTTGVYVLFENGSVLGPYTDYDAAEQSATAAVADWGWRR